MAITHIWIHNRNSIDFYDFEITSNDSLSKNSIADWLQVSPAIGFVLPLDSEEIEVTIDASLIGDRIATYKGILEINWGMYDGPKDSVALVPVNTDDCHFGIILEYKYEKTKSGKTKLIGYRSGSGEETGLMYNTKTLE